MDRRTFAQLFAIAAGAVGFGQTAAAQQGDDDASKQAVDPLQRAVNIDDLRRLAKDNLEPATYDYISTGSADGVTLRENVDAYQRIQVVPPLLHGVSKPDLSVNVLGERLAHPILLAPVAGQRMYHPDGALAAARAAAAEKTVFGVSSSAGNSVEEVARATNGPKWFQLYTPKDRKIAKQLVQRVERAGYKALVVTVDLGEWKDADRRNRFALPRDMLLKHLLDIGFPVNERMSDKELTDFNANAWRLSLSWEFFTWLRDVTKLPILIKGVLRAEDAKRAAGIGLDGIVVSNHGGRRLDGMPATIDMLPEVVQAVSGRVDVFVDGGIRRGTDILKALAAGARAVLVGRPYAWALGAGGEEGVRLAIQLLRDELENAMIACGCSDLRSIDEDLLRRR